MDEEQPEEHVLKEGQWCIGYPDKTLREVIDIFT